MAHNHPLLQGGTVGLMSGESPRFPSQIKATHENLINTLKQMGLKHEVTHGRYDTPERSVIIHKPTVEQMQTLGKLFGQESVVHSSGGQHKLIYTGGEHEGKYRTTVPGQHPYSLQQDPPENNYTHLPGVGYVNLNFDFSQDTPPHNVNGGPVEIQKSLKLIKVFTPEEKGVLTDQMLEAGAKLDANPGKMALGQGFRPKAYDKRFTADEMAAGIPATRQADAKISGVDIQNTMKLQAQAGGLAPYAYPENSFKILEHPNAYEWHDPHTGHYDEKWKTQALQAARAIPGNVQNPEIYPIRKNDQFGTSSDYARFALPYGTVSNKPTSNLIHYPYHGKLNDISKLVQNHGYKVHYAGGKYGPPDLAHKNYDTNHLMIYDPTPNSGGDFGHEEYTKGWRQIHELAHALTRPEINQIYGEGRRMGKLGVHRTPHEAARAVHWEYLAAHKQRELSKQLGIHIPDETFNKELNTIMHDAVHRAVTGKFSSPVHENFQPHSHKVPLQTALDTVRAESDKMGIKSPHSLAAPAQPQPVQKAERNYQCATCGITHGDPIAVPRVPSGSPIVHTGAIVNPNDNLCFDCNMAYQKWAAKKYPQAKREQILVPHSGNTDSYAHPVVLDQWKEEGAPGAVNRHISNIANIYKSESRSPILKRSKLAKAWPKSQAVNSQNAQGFLNHPVNQDAYMAGTGAVPSEDPGLNPAWSPSYFNPGLGYPKVADATTSANPDLCNHCGEKPKFSFERGGIDNGLCDDCDAKAENGYEAARGARYDYRHDAENLIMPHADPQDTDSTVFGRLNNELPPETIGPVDQSDLGQHPLTPKHPAARSPILKRSKRNK